MFKRTTSNTRKLGLTSLIDMVFLLLVFFMLTTTFQRNQATRINFGQASHVEVVGDVETLVVTVRGDGKVGLGPLALSRVDFRIGLFDAVQATTADTQLVVQTTPDATVQQLVAIMDMVQMVSGVTVTVVEGMVPGTELHKQDGAV